MSKLSPNKFSYQKIFVTATPCRCNMHTLYTCTVMKNSVHLIFVHNRAYETFLTTKIPEVRYMHAARRESQQLLCILQYSKRAGKMNQVNLTTDYNNRSTLSTQQIELLFKVH